MKDLYGTTYTLDGRQLREGRKPGVFMNPRDTHKSFWPGEKELNLHIKNTTLEPNYNQLFLNLGRVSHECR
jgi:hypothetical protein